MALKDLEIRRLSAKQKPYKVADERGLFLLVQPSGAKLWKMKYRFHGYERKLAFGRYPEVSLSKARERRDEARQMLADGLDPLSVKRQAEAEAKISAATTFKEVAEEYIDRMVVEGRSEATISKARWFLKLLDRSIPAPCPPQPPPASIFVVNCSPRPPARLHEPPGSEARSLLLRGRTRDRSGAWRPAGTAELQDRQHQRARGRAYCPHSHGSPHSEDSNERNLRRRIPGRRTKRF